MTPGVSGDGWWTGEDLVKQVQEKAIPIFEERFPGAIGVFAFDNATSHSAFASDALVAKRMNLSSKGKQPKMRYYNYVTDILSFYTNYILFLDPQLLEMKFYKIWSFLWIIQMFHFEESQRDCVLYCQNVGCGGRAFI